MKEIFLQPVHQPFRELVNPGFFQWIVDNRTEVGSVRTASNKMNLVLDEAEQKMRYLLQEIKRLSKGSGSETRLARTTRLKLEVIMNFPALAQYLEGNEDKDQVQIFQYLHQKLAEKSPFWGPLLGWLFTHQLGSVVTEIGQEEVSRSWVDEWLLGKILANTFSAVGFDENEAWRKVSLAKILIGHQNWHKSFHQKEDRTFLILQSWLRDREIQNYIGVNRYQGVLWFNKESFEDLLWWMFAAATADIAHSESDKGSKEAKESATRQIEPGKEGQAGIDLAACFEIIKKMQEAEDKSDYQIDKLIEAAKD
jgi:small nuclear ribonucleoprotein (snRNP)-like protein